jgi:cytochrome c|tara:strand:- start:10134 stop:10616 length:483 start_codon:yes stop_codon:yes gene_type:complete
MTFIKRLRRYRAPFLPLLLSVLAACSYEGGNADGAAEVSESGGISDWSEMAEKASDESLAKGERLFQMCTGCHSIEEGEPSPAGPGLFGFAGRRVGSLESYPYTQALANSTQHWTVSHFDAFIASPYDVYPGTGMAFSGLKNELDRQALIAFIGARLSEP